MKYYFDITNNAYITEKEKEDLENIIELVEVEPSEYHNEKEKDKVRRCFDICDVYKHDKEIMELLDNINDIPNY